jgi:N-acetylneuraminic acid mutarotase
MLENMDMDSDSSFSTFRPNDWIFILGFILFSLLMGYSTTAITPTSGLDSEDSPTWSNGQEMPTPRTEALADHVVDKIYVMGGVDYSKARQVDKVEVYDTKTDEWITSAKPMPLGIDHGSSASYNGKIYVVGGFIAGKAKVSTDKLFIYDPEKDEWVEGKPLPSPRGALTAEFINGTLYAVGGLNSSQVPVNTNEAYDPETDTWSTKAPMPTARHHLASAVIDGKLFAMGGRILGDGVPSEDMDAPLTNFNRNEMYDPKTDTWVVKQPMLDKRSGLAATSANGLVYVFGGEGVNKAFDSVEKYDPATNKWAYEPSMPSDRIGLNAVTVDNKIYTIGGHTITPESRIVALDVNEILSVKNENEKNK